MVRTEHVLEYPRLNVSSLDGMPFEPSQLRRVDELKILPTEYCQLFQNTCFYHHRPNAG